MDEQLYHEFFELEDRHWWFVARRAILRDLIQRTLQLPAGSEILDVGCGTGAFLADLARDYGVTGTDTSPLAIDYCRRRGLRNVIQCTLDSFPLPDRRFDLIMLLDVIEHVDNDAGLLQAAGALLQPTGRILVTVPAYQFLWSHHDDINHHKRRYTAFRLTSTLERARVRVQKVSYLNTFLFPLALAERLAERFLPHREQPTLSMPPAIINSLFRTIFASERHLLRSGSFPFGLSILAIGAPLHHT